MSSLPLSRNTKPNKIAAVLRIVAAAPLLLFGAMHLIDPAPFREILEAGGLPLVDLNLIAAPLAEIAAGLLLITGFHARIGAILGIATMVPAAWATVVIAGLGNGPEVPPLPVPLAVLAISILVLVRGAGSWSLDLRSAGSAATASSTNEPAAAPRG